MRIWPFWRFWYFSRDQRIALIFLCLFIGVLVAVRRPVYNYILKKKQKEWQEANQQEWASIKSQIEQSKLAVKKQRELNGSIQGNVLSEKITTPYQTPDNKIQFIEVNMASVSEWEKLRGIGPVLSERIIKYREKLGGFYSLEQIKEVYGISDSLFSHIQPSLRLKIIQLRKINPNQADFETLSAHPYISSTLAKQIIGYRTKIRRFESMEDLRQLYNMNDSIYQKLIPYMVLDEQ